MTGDVAHVWSPDFLRGDWALGDGGLIDDGGLATAVILSLFSDAQAASDDDLPDGTTDRRGYWSDSLNDESFGSRLWLLSREKTVEAVRLRAEEYAREALAWMIDGDVADAVLVTGDIVGTDRIDLLVIVERGRERVYEGRHGLNWLALIGGGN